MKSIPYLFTAVTLASLSACTTTPTIQKVEVPVIVRCKSNPVVKPSMPFDEQAKKEMSIYQKTQLLVAQDYRHKAYEAQLEAAVQACSEPASSPIGDAK